MNAKQYPPLKDFPVPVKLKIALLWASVTFFYLYGDYFELYIPGKVDGLLHGNNLLDTPTNLLLASILLALPSVMVCLSVLLPPAPNRLLNGILGGFYTLLMLGIAALSLDEWHLFYVFYALVESVLTFIILRLALDWPREQTS